MSADKTDGQLYIEKLTKEFTDITATEADLGFGGEYSDFRNPITQVEIYKRAEAEAKKTYKGETPKDLIAKAEKLHKKTPGKFRKENTEIPEGYYDEDTLPETETEDTSVPSTEPLVEEPVVEDPVVEPSTAEPETVPETPKEEEPEEVPPAPVVEETVPDDNDQDDELNQDQGEPDDTESESKVDETPEPDPVIPEEPEQTP